MVTQRDPDAPALEEVTDRKSAVNSGLEGCAALNAPQPLKTGGSV
jgi:hypothetical protein